MMPATVPAFTRIYTDAQRDALAHAYEDRRIKPARRVVELAANGELEWEGDRLDPFTTNADTVRDLARELRKKRAGLVSSELANAEPRDAIEALRRRLINLGDALLRAEERRKPETVDPARAREIARYVREAAALPGPKDARPHKPGTRVNGRQEEGQTRSKIGRDLLDAYREKGGRAKPRNGQHSDPEGQGTGAPQAQDEDDAEQEEAAEDGAHGSSARGAATSPLVPST